MTDLHEEFQERVELDNEDDFVYLDEPTTIPKPRKKIPYEQIRAQYIIGKRVLHEDGTSTITDYTVKELADLHKAYYPLVQRRSAKEKWSLQRAAYKARLQENAENTALNIYLHEGAIADTQAMIATNKLNKIYKMALSRYDNIVEAYDSDRALDDDEKIDVKELKDLLAIGKDLHTLSQQVVKSRTALVEKDMVKDLQQYKTRALSQPKKTVDTKAISDRLAHLQNILAAAQPTIEDKS
jgi:hypothetical protein